VLNLLLVLAGMRFFKESKILKVLLTLMCLCTFIMIASSAMRMILYIKTYHLTFLRILVLWGLLVLFVIVYIVRQVIEPKIVFSFSSNPKKSDSFSFAPV